MASMLFRRRSLAEIKERGRQGTNIAAERLGLSSLNQLPTDEAMFQLISAGTKIASASDTRDHFRGRAGVPFYPAFRSPERTINVLRQEFPTHVSSMIEKADRVCDGVFDLLGHRGLYFGGQIPDWHFDPISDRTSPRVHWSRIHELDATGTGDKKVIWELNRHQYFTTLGQAYWLTGDEKYAETFVAHLESWFLHNPPKIGVNWLSSLELAFRCTSWIWAFHFFKHSPSFGATHLLNMLKYLYLQGRHLENYLSTYFSPNTHLTGEALGLYTLAVFLPELKRSRHWRQTGYRVLMDALDFQVRPDGVYCEQASHYQRYTSDFYVNLLLLRRFESLEIESKHQTALSRLMDVLLHIAQPNGKTPLFGDDDGGRYLFLDDRPIDDFRPTLALGATLLDRDDLKFAAGEPTAELVWLLGTEGLERFSSIEAIEPEGKIGHFPDGGIYTVRTEWGPKSNHLVVDCGPHGFLNGGHAHADALGVILSISGQPLLIDSGTFNYTADLEARNRFRLTGAHNCLTVDGVPSALPAGPFSWKSIANSRLQEWRQDSECVHFRGVHDGFRSLGVEYARGIDFSVEGDVTITDFLSCADAHKFELHFILAPGLSVGITGGTVTIAGENGTFASIEGGATANGEFLETIWSIEDWLVSFRYGSVEPTQKLKLTLVSRGEISITNHIRAV